MRTEGVFHMVHGSAAGNRIQKIFFCNLSGSKDVRVIEHHICVKLRGDALSKLIVVREDVYTTLRARKLCHALLQVMPLGSAHVGSTACAGLLHLTMHAPSPQLPVHVPSPQLPVHTPPLISCSPCIASGMASGDLRHGKQPTVVAEDNFPDGLRVLAVDDDRVCLRVLAAVLRQCNYKPTVVTDGMTALKMLREEGEEQFDLVITDVHMPNMDGFQLLEIIGLEMDLPNQQQNQMEGVNINNTTSVGVYSEQMMPLFNMASNTASMEMANANFSSMMMVNGGSTSSPSPNLQASNPVAPPAQMVNGGGSSSSALPGHLGSSIAPQTQMLNGGEGASGILPVQDEPAGQQASYDQPAYSTSNFLDDIFASMASQDFNPDATLLGEEY
ncbi:hypothetical protein QYE76_036779 [Lolium multiflorum]|uniref:Response regulatory domain-containing protein n=1 Tax=Lolium multiflorum TaxID=4521 RepID=A0AAD8R346_LOLMU|nr:hypothetical protein QYE76_036779 [Lolium multiflorum]